MSLWITCDESGVYYVWVGAVPVLRRDAWQAADTATRRVGGLKSDEVRALGLEVGFGRIQRLEVVQ